MYTRQSTLIELSRTRIGRLLGAVIARQAGKNAKNADEARLYAGAAAYLSVEQIVFMSRGKLGWPVADSVIDLANGRPGAVARRLLGLLPYPRSKRAAVHR